MVSSSKKTLFIFFERWSACLYFFSSTWLEGFLWSNKFLNFCFQGAHKKSQTRASKQINGLSFFFICNGFEIWFLGEKVKFLRFLSWKRQDVFQATFSRFLLHLYFVHSRDVCVCFHECVCGQTCVCLCVLEASLKILPRKQIFKCNWL